MQPTPPLRSRLTHRVAAEARLAGQAAQLPKLGANFDGCRSGWWRAADTIPVCLGTPSRWAEKFELMLSKRKRKTNVLMNEEIRDALSKDRTIDIITIGAKSGLPRRIEIWFTNVNGRIIICGTPNAKGGKGPYSPRDWLANLRVHPEFTFCLKESLKIELPAEAMEIVDPEDRRYLMSAPETKWYRDQVGSVDDLVNESPIVEVFLRGLAQGN